MRRECKNATRCKRCFLEGCPFGRNGEPSESEYPTAKNRCKYYEKKGDFQMSLVRTCEGKFATYTMTKMPVVKGVKSRCDKCGEWFEEQWEIRRIVNKNIHPRVWPSNNQIYCKDCANEVWYYDVLGYKKEASK